MDGKVLDIFELSSRMMEIHEKVAKLREKSKMIDTYTESEIEQMVNEAKKLSAESELLRIEVIKFNNANAHFLRA